MFKTLIKIQLQIYLDKMSGGKRAKENAKKGKKKKGNALYVILYAYVAIVFIALFYSLFNSLASPMESVGIGWLYFTLYGIMAFAIMFLFTVYLTESQLYDAKDNELLLSMPVPTGYIVGSRIAALVLENFAYGIVIAIPVAVAWIINNGISALGAVAFVVITLLLPFLAFSISAVFGYLLHIILSKSKYKTLLGTLFSVVFLVAYIVVYSRINTYIDVLINNGENIARSLSGVLPLYWLGAAVSDGNLLYLLFVLLIICAIFALVYFLLSATFVRATLNKRSDSRVKYKRQTLKSSSASTALLKKEFKRLTSSTAYIMNAGVGIIMELIGCVFLVIKRDEITDVLGMDGEFGSIIVPIIIVTMCFFQSMSLFSAPSISLEGKNIYFLKSLPVEPKKILMAKVNMHFLVTSPVSIIVSLVFMFILKPGALMSVFLIVLPLLINGLTAFGGVAVNLRFPKLEWTNEVQVIKQGTSIIICMFGGMFVVLIPVLLYGFLLVKYLSVELALAIFAALLILGIAALYVHLSKKGTKRFLEL